MSNPIRISYLPQPFVYKKMEDIESARARRTTDELPHRHDFFTIIVVEKSSGGIHQIDFQNYPLTQNTVFFIAPEQIHHIETGAEVSGHVVMFTTDFLMKHSLPIEQLRDLELFFNCSEARPMLLDAGEIQKFNLFFQKFATESTAQRSDQWEILGAWLKIFLLELRQLKAKQIPDIQKPERRQIAIVRRFRNEVEKNFTTWHHVTDYAASQHLTANYLNEVIKSETGTTAKDFILNRIILEAKRLAQYSDLSAKEIAYRLDYDDLAQFSKFFKKHTGLTFSEFKEKQVWSN
jgi:AraC family transcriptional regulator, transcriptional activator of pobA